MLFLLALAYSVALVFALVETKINEFYYTLDFFGFENKF
jgi:hypothetical protein